MKESMFTDLEQTLIRRHLEAMLKSPDGRALGRATFVRELNKPDGDFPGATNEVLDILAGLIRDLYGAEAPVLSR